MRKLIEELKREHKRITQVLNEVRDAGIATPQGQELLYSAKTLLLFHLKKEDVQLYPALGEAAKQDERLRRILDEFAEDMRNVTRVVFGFFDKYSHGGADAEFVRDFAELLSVLAERVHREETILYPQYDRLSARPAPAPLQDLLEKFARIEGFDSVGVFTPDGELVVKLGPENHNLQNIGALAKRIIAELRNPAGAASIAPDPMIRIETQNLYIFIRCHDGDADPSRPASQKARFYLVLVTTSASGAAMAGFLVNNLFSSLAAEFTV